MKKAILVLIGLVVAGAFLYYLTGGSILQGRLFGDSTGPKGVDILIEQGYKIQSVKSTEDNQLQVVIGNIQPLKGEPFMLEVYSKEELLDSIEYDGFPPYYGTEWLTQALPPTYSELKVCIALPTNFKNCITPRL